MALSVWAKWICIRDPDYIRRNSRWNKQTAIALMFSKSHEICNAQTVVIRGAKRPRFYPRFSTPELHYHGRAFEATIWDPIGLEIHEPDCPILSPDAVGRLGWKR